MGESFERLVQLLERRYDSFFPLGYEIPFALQLVGEAPRVFGSGTPCVTVVVNSCKGVSALSTLDRTTIGEAYLAGDLDVHGDLSSLLAMRKMFRDRHPFGLAWRFLRPLLFGQVASDKKWITPHYKEDPDFYLLFLDRKHRCYSQAIFAYDEEPLEDAMTRKLNAAIEIVRARPGDHVLDIGGGYGAFVEHAGRKGIRVTSLTISEPQRRFISELITRQGLPCRVLREHFFEHDPAEQYDAIVIMGVTEHLPDYGATLAKYRSLLKPGGRVYLDTSAARNKYRVSTFFERHIFSGNGSPMCLHHYLSEVSRTPFEVVALHNDRHSYYLTALRWGQNLDAHREEIEARWGRAQFCKFQLFLWGCADGFRRDVLQAYRMVLELLPA